MCIWYSELPPPGFSRPVEQRRKGCSRVNQDPKMAHGLPWRDSGCDAFVAILDERLLTDGVTEAIRKSRKTPDRLD